MASDCKTFLNKDIKMYNHDYWAAITYGLER